MLSLVRSDPSRRAVTLRDAQCLVKVSTIRYQECVGACGEPTRLDLSEPGRGYIIIIHSGVVDGATSSPSGTTAWCPLMNVRVKIKDNHYTEEEENV